MKIAIACLLCALVCTAIAYPAEKQTLEEEIAQAELFNRLRSAFKNVRTKIGGKFGALKNRLCGITPAASESKPSLEPAFAMDEDDYEDAQIEAFAEAMLQSLQDQAEMEGWLDNLKDWGANAMPYITKSLPYVKTGLSLIGKKR